MALSSTSVLRDGQADVWRLYMTGMDCLLWEMITLSLALHFSCAETHLPIPKRPYFLAIDDEMKTSRKRTLDKRSTCRKFRKRGNDGGIRT